MFISDKFNELLNEFNNNRNSHSYIFYTNDFFSCQKDIYNFIKKLFNEDNLNLLETDFIVIKKSDKKNILKDEIIGIKNMFQTKSYINKYRVYLIEEVHKLNQTTANMILKFLEEPMDKVIALFITDNLDAVLGTIKSRCQIVNAFYEIENEDIDDKTVEKLNDLLFNNNKNISFFRLKENFGKLDRNELITIFEKLLKKCSLSKDIKELNKIIILNQAIEMLVSNVNVDYVFDFVLLKGSD